ncbi:MAG: dockerin type I repeat-containing protein [Clostridia bacterium]|nr:dockerin type I repeat-containing protein [Clostridia bacterium]
MKQTIKKLLTLALSLAIVLSAMVFAVPAQAISQDTATDFMAGNYGIFMHYLPSGDAKTDLEAWNEQVASFNVDTVAMQAHEAGAKWVTITLTQSNGFYCIPMDDEAIVEAFGGNYGVDAENDLVLKLYEALSEYGIKLMLYWIPGAPSGEDEVAVSIATSLGATEKASDGNYVLNDTTVEKMSTVMEVVSRRYGDMVAGWWIDSCYERVGFSEDYANLEAAALRAGNPDAVIAFNSGISGDKPEDVRYACESYAAGEICNYGNLDTVSIYDYSATGRWTPKGYQKHYLTFLGENWGDSNAERYDTNELVAHVTENLLKKGCALSLDVGCGTNGTFDPEQLNQVVAINTAMNSNPELGFDFENGQNLMGVVSNVYEGKDHYSNDSAYVQLSTEDEALNGKASLKILPSEGNSRTDILVAHSYLTEGAPNRLNIKGNTDFSKSDFTNLSGIMMRVKIENDTATSNHSIGFYLSQTGLSHLTVLGNKMVLYNADGSKFNVYDKALPAGFDGFVFIPFKNAHSIHEFEPGKAYSNYTNNPDVMVDFAKDYKLDIRLNSSNWNGATVLIDDVNYYYGENDADAWNTMRALGYDITQAEQPEVYSFPLNGENLWKPIPSTMLIAKTVTTGGVAGWPKYNNLPSILTNDPDEVLNGNVSMKISVDINSFNWTGLNSIAALKVTTDPFTVAGVEALSTEKIKSAASNKYAYLKLRIKIPATNSALSFYPIIEQNGNRFVIEENILAYNADGSVNSSVILNSGGPVSLPSGFDGYLYAPIYSIKAADFNDYTYTPTGSPVYQSDATAPDLDQNFELRFQFSTSSTTGDLNVANIYFDDIDVVYGTGTDLPYNFDDFSKTTPTVYGQVTKTWGYPPINNISYLTSENALNGQASIKVDIQNLYKSENSSYYYYNAVKFANVPAVTDDGIAGVMYRLKLENDTNTETHRMYLVLTQSEMAETCVGGNAIKLYDAEGNALVKGTDYTTDVLGVDIPIGFDGFVFVPYKNFYNRTQNGKPVVDISAEHNLELWFWGTNTATDGVYKWQNVDALIDDVSYYSVADADAGLTDVDVWNAMKSLGYDIMKAQQPASYSIPLDFEGFEAPFNKVTSWYSKGTDGNYGQYYTKYDFVGGESALSGKASLKVTAGASDAYNAEGRNFIRAETTQAVFNGIPSLDKETLSLANTNFAYITMRVKVPFGGDGYSFQLFLNQTGVTQNGMCATHGYTAEGVYTQFVTDDGVTTLPSGFDGTIYIPVANATARTELTDESGNKYRPTYRKSAEYMVDLTQQFKLSINLQDTDWEGKSLIIDDITLEIDGVMGDINGDGSANGADLVIVSNHILGIDRSYGVACDITGEGAVNIIDLIRLKKIIANIAS